MLGKNNVAVPTHFFKVVVMEAENQKLDMEAYVMPNAVIANDTPLNVFQVSLIFNCNALKKILRQFFLQVPPETIERAAGLLFFDKITRKSLNKINGKWA